MLAVTAGVVWLLHVTMRIELTISLFSSALEAIDERITS